MWIIEMQLHFLNKLAAISYLKQYIESKYVAPTVLQLWCCRCFVQSVTVHSNTTDLFTRGYHAHNTDMINRHEVHGP